uniref:Kinesin motor domain-containing protein n=1 Tax=Brassica oleracea var. oleracea TaxID=109376 RepID=A0A0D3CHY7_BRAOL
MRKINTDSPENGIYNGSLKEEYHCAKLHIVYLAGSERAKRTGSDGMKVKEGVYINKGLLALALNILVNAGFVSLMLAMTRSAKIPNFTISAPRAFTCDEALAIPLTAEAENTTESLPQRGRARPRRGDDLDQRSRGGEADDEKRRRSLVALKFRDSEARFRRRRRDGTATQRLMRRLPMAIPELPRGDEQREIVNPHARRGRSVDVSTRVQETRGATNKKSRRPDDAACISTADINAEEILNTLKYAIRARNIRNKPVVNRDHVSSEMLKMRQQLEYLQAELPLRDGGSSCANSRYAGVKHSEKKFKDIQYDEIIGLVKPDGLKRSLHNMESSNYAMVEATIGDSREIDEEAKEWEHKLLQSSMDKELHELNRRLEEKESEMKVFDGYDPAALKQHFGKKVAEVEDEKRFVQVEYVLEERNRLLAGIENLASDGEAQKLQDVHAQNLKSLEAQLQDLKKSEYKRHKLQASNQRQKMRKIEEAAMGTKRLKELLEARKSSPREHTHVVHTVLEQSSLAGEFSVLRQVDELAVKGLSPPRGKNGFVWASSLSPNARMARISSLENSSAYLQIL